MKKLTRELQQRRIIAIEISCYFILSSIIEDIVC